MTDTHAKHAALTTILAFHYQVLIGIERCFALKDGQSIWFESDGDVSQIGVTAFESIQYEVKDYADPLTDHHENLWKTLKNWLSKEFNHDKYSALVLHTTQPFGVRSSLKEWNQKDVVQRLQILNEIFATRSAKEKIPKNRSSIVNFQCIVMETEKEKLKELLGKVVLFTEADNEQQIKESILEKLVGIPRNNQASYLQGIIGFVYGSSNQNNWVVSKSAFNKKCEELTNIYCKRQFTLPSFTGREATEEEVLFYQEKPFVQKIECIEYAEVIPEAVGNWIELHNSLNEELDEAPQFRHAANKYQSQLVKQFQAKYRGRRRYASGFDPIMQSQDLYDEIIGEGPAPIDGYLSPPIEFKNGLIHAAMDDEERNLQWRIES